MPAQLVVQTSFLGDMVLTTPLLRELATRGPVDVVATPASAGLLANHPAVRETIVYDKRGDGRGARGLWRLAVRLRRSGYDVAHLAQGSLRSAALVKAAGVPERIGFATSSGRLLYSRRIEYRDDVHHAERLWRLAMEDAAPSPVAERVRPSLHPGEAERAAVDALLSEHDAMGEPCIALAPGSIWPTKRWPSYTALAAVLAARARLVILGGAADAPLAAEIAAAVPHERVIDATGRLSLLASAELLGRCVALVTNDSAPQHLASAMGTPTVAIFGPTVPEFGFGPLAPRRAVVGHDALDCRPCDRHGPRRCPLGHWRCMRDVSPSSVAAALDRVLSTSTS